MAGSAAVRMYNVGFGDAFLVSVTREKRTWRMLVDCGVHPQGQARPIAETVKAIISDVTKAPPAGQPLLDVVVATHHHADHISGFALDAWETVSVGEVWVPFVEDPDDEDAKKLRQRHSAAAAGLTTFLEHRLQGLGPGQSPVLEAAHAFALNSRGNAAATDRLLGRNGLGFAAPHRVRYLPAKDTPVEVIDTGMPKVTAHILGPSRDPAHLGRMDPPAGEHWLNLAGPDPAAASTAPGEGLFAHAFVQPEDLVPTALRERFRRLELADLGNDEALLAAAGLLERAVNNTSVFFVLDVAGTRLLFPGDAQQGAWEHVLDDADRRALVEDAAFYKIGHHGSHNATPRRFVKKVTRDGGAEAMLPWGLVERWADTIPKTELLEALTEAGYRITRADAPQPSPPAVAVKGKIWSEVTIKTP